jgi:hypothetical protein
MAQTVALAAAKWFATYVSASEFGAAAAYYAGYTVATVASFDGIQDEDGQVWDAVREPVDDDEQCRDS